MGVRRNWPRPALYLGKTQVYPRGKFGDHLKPFIAAINAGASAIMPYYGVPINVTYSGVGRSDRHGLLQADCHRPAAGTLGFKGYVNSDTGVVTSRAWGLESKSVPERVAIAINGGTDILSGFSRTKPSPILSRLAC